MEHITDAKSYIGKEVVVTIDRPFHSKHPKHGFTYELNYGFVPGTLSRDGEELDAYVLGVTEPIKSFSGICIAVIHRLNDSDDKLVVVPKSLYSVSDQEITAATHFQEQFFKSIIVRLK